MKKITCLMIFIIICFITFFYLHLFTDIGSPDTYINWQSAEYTDENGNTSAVDKQEVSPNTRGSYTFVSVCDNIKAGGLCSI